jgi:DASS family divalent anion:Na+ symporter
LSIFIATVTAMILRPIPAGAAVLVGALALVVFAKVPLAKALDGYRDATVWLVLAAYFLSHAFQKTGLARRIALQFIRRLGRTSLGLCYAMTFADMTLASMIPSNAARVGGVITPIAKAIAESFGSRPGPTAVLLGQFLFLSLYQADVVNCSLFFTGQAGNPIAADQANKLLDASGQEFRLDYRRWTLLAVAPGMTLALLTPWLIHRSLKPTLKVTVEAISFAGDELKKLGSIQRDEWLLIAVFAAICFRWITLKTGGSADAALPALLGVVALIIIGVVDWRDLIADKSAWDVFIWYGGVVMMGNLLHETGITRDFAHWVVGLVRTIPAPNVVPPWVVVAIPTLLIYFYAHYAFASITTHVIALYPAFAQVLLEAGAPPVAILGALAIITNLSACLTHFGTTPGPIIFGLGYVSQGTWWKIGLMLSFVHLLVWSTVGVLWFRILGVF